MVIEKFMTLGGIVALASLTVSLLIVFSQKWHGAFSHDHDLQGVQKVHTSAVPRIGGIAVVGGLVAGWCIFLRIFPDVLPHSNSRLVDMLLLVSIPAFLAGIVEDITKKVSVKLRLSATIASALLASLMLGATVDELDIWGFDALLSITPFAILVTAIVVAGAANAINIIDGFNGLSSMTLIIMALGLCIIAWQNTDELVFTLGMLCIGATLGFVVLNYPIGKLFLGDGGAYFLGFWVAEMAVLLLVRCREVNSWQVLAVCAYPIIEVMFSIYRRKFVRQVSPGLPDALHLHTLVYRRVVYFLVKRDPVHAWKRNAAVVAIIGPVVAACVSVSAVFGESGPVAMGLVGMQILIYISAYRRLVHGRWSLAISPKVFSARRRSTVHPVEKQPFVTTPSQVK